MTQAWFKNLLIETVKKAGRLFRLKFHGIAIGSRVGDKHIGHGDLAYRFRGREGRVSGAPQYSRLPKGFWRGTLAINANSQPVEAAIRCTIAQMPETALGPSF